MNLARKFICFKFNTYFKYCILGTYILHMNSMNYFRKRGIQLYIEEGGNYIGKTCFKIQCTVIFLLNRQSLSDALPTSNECFINTKNAVDVLMTLLHSSERERDCLPNFYTIYTKSPSFSTSVL